MGNRHIPRSQVHDWIDDIDANKATHKAAINYLLTSQRGLSRFVATQAGQVAVGSRRKILFIQGAILRVFDLASGKIGKVTRERIAEAEERIAAVAGDMLPLDDGFASRVRTVEWRAQAHLVDELLMSLFDDDELDARELAKLFFLMWVVVEAVDAVWKPGADFEGETEYEYVHIEE